MTELHLVDLERDALDAFFIILHSFLGQMEPNNEIHTL